MAQNSKNSAILVTGGAIRVGAAISRHLARAGYEIIIHANSSSKEAELLCEEICKGGAKAKFIIGDLGNTEFVAGLINAATKIAETPLLGLINNASVFENDNANDFTNQSWDRHFTINAQVPCQLSQKFAQQLGKNHGVIVNIIDQRVFRPNPLFFSYSLSKQALLAATKSMAQAFAPNIRVNGIAPGPSLQNSRQAPEDFAAQVNATILKTGSPPEAIAQATEYLLAAAHVTGQIIAVDGGQSLIWNAPDIDGIKE